MKSRRMRWVEHLARKGEKRNAYRFLAENLKKRDHVKGLGVDGIVILKMYLEELE
jgi:hypothetical protein